MKVGGTLFDNLVVNSKMQRIIICYWIPWCLSLKGHRLIMMGIIDLTTASNARHQYQCSYNE